MALSALGLGGAGAAAAWLLRARPRRGGGAVRLPFILPKESSVLLPASRQALALAPDGSQFVYVANNQLFRRSLSELAAHPDRRAPSEFGRVHQPVFSPDGASLAFWAESDRTIKRVSVQGGRARTHLRGRQPVRHVVGRRRAAARPGAPRHLACGRRRRQSRSGFSASTTARKPTARELLPDGAVLYTIATGVEWLRWDDGAHRRACRRGVHADDRRQTGGRTHGICRLPGTWCSRAAATLLAAGFDVRRRRLTTAPVPVIEGVRRGNNRDTGVAHFSISDTGRLIYVPGPFIGPEWGEQEIVIADRSGAVERAAASTGRVSRRARVAHRAATSHSPATADRRASSTPATCPAPMTMRPTGGTGQQPLSHLRRHRDGFARGVPVQPRW